MSIDPAKLVDRNRERSLGRHRRVLLSHRSGRSVAWIGILAQLRSARRVAFLVLGSDCGIHRFKAALRHVDLAAYFEGSCRRAPELVRHGSDRLGVGRHILTRATVTSGCGLHQSASLVDEGNRQPVDLRLGYVSEVVLVEQFRRASSPIEQFVGVECVAQREHP